MLSEQNSLSKHHAETASNLRSITHIFNQIYFCLGREERDNKHGYLALDLPLSRSLSVCLSVCPPLSLLSLLFLLLCKTLQKDGKHITHTINQIYFVPDTRKGITRMCPSLCLSIYVRLSVCLSVCHVPAFMQNSLSQKTKQNTKNNPASIAYIFISAF